MPASRTHASCARSSVRLPGRPVQLPASQVQQHGLPAAASLAKAALLLPDSVSLLGSRVGFLNSSSTDSGATGPAAAAAARRTEAGTAHGDPTSLAIQHGLKPRAARYINPEQVLLLSQVCAYSKQGCHIADTGASPAHQQLCQWWLLCAPPGSARLPLGWGSP